jgi:predicted O-linked N-acetylglucosamine transferase (SPINDLY family)
MDYRLTDSLVDPPGRFDRFYSEQSIRLPDSFGCYDPMADGPAVSALPALEQGWVTVASLNNFCKVNRPTLKLWARAMNAVPRSHLMILAPEGPHRDSAVEALEQEGVHPDRVNFVSSLPRARYLELYHRIDISLDALPYNGQTTSLDSLWMGAPVVTLAGGTAVGRAGLSLLHTLGLPEWAAETPDQFVQIVARWGGDLAGLADLRATLRRRMQASPLMDGARFARGVEAAYRTMWRSWCARTA